ncbi:ABC transporter substrate-binding protein [Rhodococcoides corynebacterioides]|uniref:ABC transporter substrate-binding protein n=1 Tax=Rhodococcoides corynebacterioides TaxID=53972 RepID=A0ABS7NZG1_9NOCA|nr:ABC transporter substrate-binding protein [Rhodococcus corynebacterioides]MBY6365521.1 ABC transporter substrate-binding protein [Rhodococcus corynebacterioides]MBY6408623.1 ABC transporter substrate-binding protein [Rhodococcus corynebacterioides]
MVRPRRPLLVTAATGAAATLLAGCFSAAAPADAEDRLRLAMLQPPRSALSPFSDDAFKLSRWSTAETLVTLDDLGAAQPALATAWTRVDERTFSFDLRPDVRFHDGAPLTADAVVAVLRAATAAAPKPRILDGVELTATATDADTVSVATATPDPLLPQRLSSPQLAVLSPAAYAGGPVDPVRHGTGPFVLTAVNGTSGATLERNDDYWGEPARLAGIDVDFVPDGTARAAALRNGTADVVEAVPVSQAASVDPALIHEVPMPRTNTLYLNNRTGPFTDPALRAAAREAVDADRIVDQVYEGRADAARGLLGPALPWSADRPARTAAAAGDAAGQRITLATFTDRAELPEVAVLLQQALEARGFVVEQVVREYQFIEADALAGAFDAFVLSRATVLDSGDPVAYLYSDFACDGSFGLAQFCDPAVDRALADAAATEPGPERRTAILDAERLILERDAAVPMLHERVVQGESSRVSGVARDPRERTLITTDTALS